MVTCGHSVTPGSKAQPSGVALGDPNILIIVTAFLSTHEEWSGPNSDTEVKVFDTVWAQSGSLGGAAHKASGPSLLSEPCFDLGMA